MQLLLGLGLCLLAGGMGEEFDCRCEGEVLECAGEEMPSVIKVVDCPEADALVGRGFVVDIKDGKKHTFQTVVLATTTMTCQDVYDKVLTYGATLNGVRCENNYSPKFKTSGPRPPVLPQDGDDDNDDDDHDNQETSTTFNTTTALNTTMAGPVTTRQPPSTPRTFVIALRGQLTVYRIVLVISMTLILTAGVTIIVWRIRAYRARRQDQMRTPLQCPDVTSTTERTYVLRDAPPRSPRRRRGSAESIVLYAVDEL